MAASDRLARPAAAELQGDRRAQQGTARHRRRRLPPLTPRQVDQKRSRAPCSSTCAPTCSSTRRTSPGRCRTPCCAPGFGTKLAWIADRDQEIVLVGRDDDEARDAALLAVAVGIRKLGGYLHGGMTVWRAERRPVERIERIDDRRAARALADDDDLQILDVREQSEWDAGHIPGSRPRALPRHPRAAGRDRPVAAGRRDLRVGSAQRGGRQPAPAPRRRARRSTSPTAASAPGSARATRSSARAGSAPPTPPTRLRPGAASAARPGPPATDPGRGTPARGGRRRSGRPPPRRR